MSEAPQPPRRRGARRSRAAAIGFSLAAHGTLLVALFAVKPPPRRPIDVLVAPVPVALIPARRLAEAPAPEDSTQSPAPTAEPKAGRKTPNPAPLPRHMVVRPLEEAEAGGPPPGLSDADLAEAVAAGSGSGGGGGACDMARRVQAALRKDPLVQAAAADARLAQQAGGRPVLVWNGDWVKSSGQDGKGLAAVREAILWEVGFAPAVCKSEPMHGYVLLSLNEAGGGLRLALGGPEWRWGSLLGTVGR